MSRTNLTPRAGQGGDGAAGLLEKVVLEGDLSALSPAERLDYYRRVCESLGLNPLTRPFEYLELDGRLILYARKDATDQLRRSHGISVEIVSREMSGGLYVVTARASFPDGRRDESIGAVATLREEGEWRTARSGRRYFVASGELVPMRGKELANAVMRAETKAKRRVTLSIAGLGFMDESEVEGIAAAAPVAEAPAGPEAIGAEPAPAELVDARGIGEAVRARVEAVLRRARASGAWAAAREYVGERFAGSDRAYALAAIAAAEREGHAPAGETGEAA